MSVNKVTQNVLEHRQNLAELYVFFCFAYFYRNQTVRTSIENAKGSVWAQEGGSDEEQSARV